MRMAPEKSLLFLGMYPLDRLDYACPVRIFNLYQNLRSMIPTILITGTRAGRRWPILKYLVTGQLRRTSCVYVESATSTATETDLLLLLVCKLFRVPIVIYIRDAHQFFPDIYDRTPLKVRMLDWLWRRSIQFYLLFADALLFPSEGLAQQFKFSNQYYLLPPAGSSNVPLESPDISSKVVIYVGGNSLPNGVDLLLEAMELVIEKYPEAKCIIVSDAGQSDDLILDWQSESWVKFISGSFDDLPALMRDAYLAVIPYRKNSYGDLAVPVKLFDYMSFGRPVVATNCAEQAKYVKDCNSGLVVEDTVDGIADGIIRLFDNPDMAKEMGRNGYRSVLEKHSWEHRARQLLQIINGVTDHVEDRAECT